VCERERGREREGEHLKIYFWKVILLRVVLPF
jgi:hypothetical protein